MLICIAEMVQSGLTQPLAQHLKENMTFATMTTNAKMIKCVGIQMKIIKRII